MIEKLKKSSMSKKFEIVVVFYNVLISASIFKYL